MVKVKIIKTGEVKEVTPNEAHGLIEKGVAEVYKEYINRDEKVYKNRQMRATIK